MIRFLLAGAAVSALIAGVQTWRIDGLKADLDDAKDQAAAIAQRLDDADMAAQTAADQCVAREAAARQSARAIERIIERPINVDPQGCPVRELVPADELRDALQPTVPAAQPLH